MDILQNNGASAPPAEEQVRRAEEAAVGGNLVEGNPSAGSTVPQAPTQAAQNIAQGDNATPLETGLRQHGNVESQRAAEAKAARDTALTAFNRERRQERDNDRVYPVPITRGEQATRASSTTVDMNVDEGNDKGCQPRP
jgi:hypothetical protein